MLVSAINLYYLCSVDFDTELLTPAEKAAGADKEAFEEFFT